MHPVVLFGRDLIINKRCEVNTYYLSSLLISLLDFDRWESVSGVLGPYDRPVVLNRASSTNTTNPFGSTFCYGYQDIIFEVIVSI